MDTYDDVNDMWHFLSQSYIVVWTYMLHHILSLSNILIISPDLLTAIKYKSKAKRRVESTGLDADISY